MSRPRNDSLTDEFLARLGTAPDTVLAEEIGLSYHTIAYHRKRLGIPPYRAESWWTPERDAVAARDAPLQDIADELGCTSLAVRVRRACLVKTGTAVVSRRHCGRPTIWTPEMDAIIMEHPTKRAIDLTGRSRNAIYARRAALRKQGVKK